MLRKHPHVRKKPRQIDAVPQADRTKFALPLSPTSGVHSCLMPLKMPGIVAGVFKRQRALLSERSLQTKEKAISWQLQQQARQP